MVQASDYPEWEESGIYVIRNKVNGKEYVGKSKELTERNKGELRKLKKGKFHNKHLQRSYDKYGEENFEFITIKNNICPGLLGAHEILQIAIRNTDEPEHGYNKTIGGDGMIPTEEIREKMRGPRPKSQVPRPYAQGENCHFYKTEPWNKGIECPEISERMSGENNPMYGKKRPEHSERMSGEKNPAAQINEDGARKIKILKKTTNMTYQQIADCVPNASKAIVGMIIRGESWTKVKIDEDDD